jgi:hypothetical protein
MVLIYGLLVEMEEQEIHWHIHQMGVIGSLLINPLMLLHYAVLCYGIDQDQYGLPAATTQQE